MRASLLLALVLALPLAARAQKPRPPASAGKKPAAPKTGPDLPSQRPLSTAFAVVNGEKIPLSLYVDRLSVRFGPEVREMLIEETLVRQEAKRRNITAPPKEVEAAVARAFGNTVKQLGDEKRLAEELKKTRGWTVDDYRAVIREQATAQVLRNRLAAALASAESVTDAQVTTRYEEQRQLFQQPETVKLSHILVRRPDGGDAARDAAARAKADALLKKVQGGGSFEQVARESSDDRATGAQGGRIPTPVALGAHPFGAEFEKAVFGNGAGLVGQVVASPLGYHIIRVEEKKEARTVPLAEARTPIREALLQERRTQELDELLVRLRTQAKIDTGRY